MVNIEYSDRIHTIILDRADKRNALSYEMVTALKGAFREAFSHSQSRVIVLKAHGPAFCAGADLAYLQQLQKNTYEENLEDSNHLKELFQLIYTGPKPVIAQIQGHAIAGGCGLASVCDFSITVPEAKFGYTEVRIGFIPALVSVFLVRKIGEGKARDLFLSGRMISAEEACNMALINRIVPKDELEKEVFSLATSLRDQCSGQSLKATKELLQAIQDLDLEKGLDHAATLNAQARASEDCKKGIQAFLDKQEVKW